MIIRGIFTNTKLSSERMNSETTVPYIVANECPGLKRGDLVQFVGYDTKFQVVWIYVRSREQENYETITISEINGKQINTISKNNMEQFGKMNVDNVFGDLTKDMYNEFMPQAEENARITDGVLCFKNSDGAYVGVSPAGKFKKYKMTMPCIYNISKNSDQIVIGDIVKSGRSYGVVKTKAGIDNPQICFMAFGDVEGCYEEAPLQVGQFESSDELMEKWLRKVGLESKGGGNGGEDPHMCWYFAANHIKTDALEKRGIKGCLITISDEPIHKTLPKEAVTHYIGDECGEDLATSFIYRECAEKWDIYHIHVEHDGYYSVERISDSWKPYVGDNLIISDKEHVGESIARIVSNSYGQQKNS